MTDRWRVELTPRAYGDLTGSFDYLVHRIPAGAENVRVAIDATLDRLRDHPLMGRDRPELRVRSVGVPRFSYTISYRVIGDVVQIVHVRDDRRRPVKPGEA